ncbi:hypothetical protein BJF90_12555 [Pseudonocardia sp. CNS-004]|nr:hypothetical protein BJF90_12555 [Pseudonocardia sp. CNS-004]
MRSNRPGLRSALSMSHGWLVASRTNTASLSVVTESSSESIWLTVLRMLVECARCDRFWPSASSSSKNSTQGARRRASAKIRARLRSLCPVYMSRTSEMPTLKKFAPSSPATARAMNVLPHPGGP